MEAAASSPGKVLIQVIRWILILLFDSRKVAVTLYDFVLETILMKIPLVPWIRRTANSRLAKRDRFSVIVLAFLTYFILRSKPPNMIRK